MFFWIYFFSVLVNGHIISYIRPPHPSFELDEFIMFVNVCEF